MLGPWKKNYDKPRCVLKPGGITLPTKVMYTQNYDFSSSHVWKWELNHKESWVPKNWCFWTVELEKTLESPLDSKRSNHSVLTEINPKYSLEGLMLKLNQPPDTKSQLTGKDFDAGKNWGRKQKGATENEMIVWPHWVNGHDFEQCSEIVKTGKSVLLQFMGS